MLKIQAVAFEELAVLRREHMIALHAPVDGMWESFVSAANHFEIVRDGERIGYFDVDEEGRILQFHLVEPARTDAREIFREIIRREDVEGAIVSTGDPLLLVLCLDHHARLCVHTYLYRNHDDSSPRLSGFERLDFAAASADDLDAIVAFQSDSLDGAPEAWLRDYGGNLIRRGELYVLRAEEQLIATGEARVSDTQPPLVDLGVIVSRRVRGRGVAPYVLRRLKEICARRDQEPICSTTAENESAQRAIRKAGFTAEHRLLAIGFP